MANLYAIDWWYTDCIARCTRCKMTALIGIPSYRLVPTGTTTSRYTSTRSGTNYYCHLCFHRYFIRKYDAF